MNSKSTGIYDDPIQYNTPIMKKALEDQKRFSHAEMVGKSFYAISLIPLSIYLQGVEFDLYETVRHPNMDSGLPGTDGPSYAMLFLTALNLLVGGIITSRARRQQNMSMLNAIYEMNRRKD